MNDAPPPVRLPASAVDHAQESSFKRAYALTPDLDSDDVVTSPRYRFWVEGEIIAEPAEPQKRVELDQAATLLEKWGLYPRRQMLPLDVDVAALPRRRGQLTGRRYTGAETAAYVAHYPGQSDLDIAKGMFPELREPGLAVGRVRAQLTRLMGVSVTRRRDPEAPGGWRFYPLVERDRSGTVLSRDAAKFAAMRLGLTEAQVHPVIEELLRRMGKRRELWPVPDHPAWKSILNPSQIAPDSETPLCLTNPATGVTPSEQPRIHPEDDDPF